MGSQRALPLCLGVCPPACLPGSGPARALCPLCLLRSDIPARDPGGQGPTGCLPGPFSGRWLGLSPRTGPRPRGLTSQQQSPLDRHPLFGALASLPHPALAQSALFPRQGQLCWSGGDSEQPPPGGLHRWEYSVYREAQAACSYCALRTCNRVFNFMVYVLLTIIYIKYDIFTSL